MSHIQTNEHGANAHRFAPAAPDDDVVFGACCPGWHSAAGQEEALADWLSFMERRGIRRVCCLVPGRQFDGSTANLDRYREAFGEDAVLHAPSPDCRLVAERRLSTEILPFLDDADDADEPVVVHCLSGIGRTGQVLAAWLAHDRGAHAERAIATVEEMGRHPAEAVHAGNATEDELHALVASFA